MSAQARHTSGLAEQSGMYGHARSSVHNKTRVSEWVQAVKAARNVRNPSVYQDIQKKNLEAFHSTLAELKQAREEWLSEDEKNKIPDKSKNGPEGNRPKEASSTVATTQR